MKNILLTGGPGSGKTTLILKTIKKVPFKAYGFYTREIRENGERVGFELCTLNGKKGILAHKNIKSNLRVGRYGVNLKDLDEIGVKAIEDGIKNNGLIVIDEIGKMELFSDIFKSTVFRALDSGSKVLATIIERPHKIGDKIKTRHDVKLINVKDVDSKKLLDILTQHQHCYSDPETSSGKESQ
ncbi:MAG: NTPase [bacterium]|nr:NTPase [bacterium]